MSKQIKIERENLLLTEGTDAKLFFMYLLEAYKIENIDVHDYGGITDLTQYLRVLKNIDGYSMVKTIIVARDAEDSSLSAIQSINTSLRANDIIEKDITGFKLETRKKKVGILIFPGLDANGKIFEHGTLEDLCLKIFKDHQIIEKIDAYLSDFQSDKKPFKRLHKNKLHSTLSFTDKYVGLKIGETAKAHGFDFESPCFAPFLNIIKQIGEE